MVSHPPRHLFEAEELEGLLKKSGVDNIILGSSPCVSSGFRKAVNALQADEVAWKTLIDLETKAYCKRTFADNGEFLLAKGIKL